MGKRTWCALVLVFFALYSSFSKIETEGAKIGVVFTFIDGLEQGLGNTINYLSQNFTEVEGFNATFDTPSQDWINSHDAILIISRQYWGNNTLMGTRIANYIKQDGRVVMGAVYESYSGSELFGLAGEFTDEYRVSLYEYYEPKRRRDNSGENMHQKREDLGYVALFPNHPILEGIDLSINGSEYSQIRLPVNHTFVPGSYRILDWTDRSAEIIVRDGVGPYLRNRVDLGFLPVDTNDNGELEWATGLGKIQYALVVNSLNYVLQDNSYMCGFTAKSCKVPDLETSLSSYTSDFISGFMIESQTPSAGTEIQNSLQLNFTVTTPEEGSLSCSVNLECSSANSLFNWYSLLF